MVYDDELDLWDMGAVVSYVDRSRDMIPFV
jgi:hypothetical protein